MLGDAAASRAQANRFLGGRAVVDGQTTSHAEALARAHAAHAALRAPTPADSANLSTAWQPLGPVTVTSSLYGPIAGRITSVAIDPNDPTGNTLWMGTTGGGVWKGTNAAGPVAGATFSPLTDDLPAFAANAETAILPSLSIGAVAVQPAATGVVLAGTGDPNDATDSYYGEGILRSADGGQTWTVATQSQDGVNGHHPFTGLATAGLAWSTTTPSLAVAAMSTSAEAGVVAATATGSVAGLYFSNDAGSTWQMATVMDGAQVVQAPAVNAADQASVPATAVVWDAQRGLFFAALRFHGYYSSPDGQTWTRLAHQPGAGLTLANCPTNPVTGASNCPILRGALAVQPTTGDLYALTVDSHDNDLGLWQDLCNAGSNGQCASAAPAFPARLDNGAFEIGQGAAGSSTTIPQGDYDLALAAAPSAGNGTVLFVGTIDLYRCSLVPGATSCTFRNTTNAGNGCNATSAVAPAQHSLAAVAQASGAPLLFIGNDGGLWRSTDGVAQTGPVCVATDASHFDNLNPAIGKGGSLAEVVGLAQDPGQADTLIAGLGADGSAATTTASAMGSWPQMSGGEGGYPQIDPVSPLNWYVAVGTGVNLGACTSGSACTPADFLGTATVGPAQTGYDAALLDAPTLLDPQATTNLMAGTCRVWRGPAQSGSGWTSANAISPAMDGGASCTVSSALVRSLAAGGPVAITASGANSGSEVLYAGMAGTLDGGGSIPGHLFVSKAANTATGTKAWADITGSPVGNSAQAFNASGFDLSSVTVDPHDQSGATVYATVMGFGSGPHVYRSTDFGAHWTSLSADLPDAPANALVIDPDDANTVYVAMDTGVYVTRAVSTCATTNCWSVLGSGLPNAPVTELQAGANLPTGDGRVGMLRAGTYGRGLWQTPLLSAHTLAQPKLSASPSSLTFAAQPASTESDAQTITLTSLGDMPASVSFIGLAGDFVETDTCTGQTIAVGGTCTISVRFTPTAAGTRSGLLTVYADIPGGQLTVALNGTGTAPAAIVLTPAQLSFAATLVNQTAAAQIITVSNTGANPATLQPPTVTGDFAITANTCGSSLPSQTGCSISIGFTPTATGARSGILSITDSAGTQIAPLSGVGNSPATDTLSPTSLSFAQQQVGTTSTAQQVTLANAGDVPLTLITATVVGGDFAATNTCGNSLAAHSTCAVNVMFVPTATGTRTGTLQVTDQFRTQFVSLSGSGVAPAGVTLSPATIDFGSYGVGLNSPVTTLTLTNNGGVPLALTSTGVAGDFVLASSTCGATLAAGAACNLGVFFSPTVAGARTGALTLADNASGGQQTVTLTGTGIDFSLAPNGATIVTVGTGTTATYPLMLTSLTGLSGGVAFTCTGAPANSVCTVNPGSASLGNSVPITATVQTGVSSTLTSRLIRPGLTGRSGIGEILLAGAPFACLALGRKRRRRLSRALMQTMLLVLFVVALGGLSGCGATRLIPLGGTGTGGTGTGGASAPTAPGTYALTVTGTAAGVSHSLKLTLIVQ